MTVPKPKVYTFRDHHSCVRWFIACPCGFVAERSTYEVAVERAVAHSRTHTAERIAEQLDRHALARRVDSIAAIDAAGHETDYSVYQQGVAKGIEHAERLVRTHLVKETR